jgi:hypothetical protein
MTTLIIATSLSDLFVNEILLEQTRTSGDTLIIATNADVNRILKEAGLPSQFISPNIDESWTERDTGFRDLCMPGVFGDAMFFGTKLPVHKVLSIDRLSFWYGGRNARQMCEWIDSLSWDKAIVSYDLSSHLPFYVMQSANGRECVAVQTTSIRTKETYDIASRLTFDSFVVRQEDAEFLASAGYSRNVVAKSLFVKTEPIVESQGNDALRKGLGLTASDYVAGVVFDKRDEWQCRAFVNRYVSMPQRPRLMFFTFDSRSNDLLPKCLAPYYDYIQIYDKQLIQACNEVIAFRWDDYLAGIKEVTIIDYHGINMAKQIAPSGTKVMEE